MPVLTAREGAETVGAFPRLFEPFALRGVELPNRLVFLAHVTMFAVDQRPSPRHRHYYEERARGGVGLIVTESQVVHPTGGHGKCVLATRDGMLAWRDTVTAVQSHGTRFFAQLTHHGAEAFSVHTMLPQWGPSAVADPAVGETPKAMTHTEIREAQDSYRRAAGYAVEAGFDGVELKVGHDGLLRMFLSPFYNRRRDEYGHASVEDRLRFVAETLAGVRAEIGDVPLGIRFCVDEGIPGGYGLDEGIALAAALAETGTIDYVSADMGTWTRVDLQVPPAGVAEGYADDAVAALRRATGLPAVAFGRIVSPGHASSLLERGAADLIGMCRQLLADPEWPVKVATGRADEIRPCVHCNQECVGRLMRDLPISCVHNPAAGREEQLGRLTLTPTATRRRVVVVGGGVAGLKTAEVAALRGHDVVLFERAERLGGQVAVAASVPHHDEWGEIAVALARRVHALGVDVRLGVEATTEAVERERPDAVVLATGSGPGVPPFPVDGIPVYDEWQAVGGDVGEREVVVFDLGVRSEGATVVEALASRGAHVRWVAPTPTVAFQLDPGTLAVVLPRLARLGVERIAETAVVAATPAGVVLANVFDGTTRTVSGVDAIVVVGNKDAAPALELGDVELHAVGDCVAPRHVAIAIYEGELAGRAL